MKDYMRQSDLDEIDGEPKRSILDEMDSKHAVVVNGGDTAIIRWEENSMFPGVMSPKFMTKQAFALQYANCFVKVKVKKGEGTAIESRPATKIWIESRKRATYEGMDMFPDCDEKIVNGRLNLWTGFSVVPKRGNWSRMKKHICEVLADGNQVYADYIMRWAAWKFQNPGGIPEVALCFRGGKGSGKGAFARSLRQIFGAHGLHVSNHKHVTGNFNSHLLQCALLYSDEAMWPGNKSDDGTIKRMVTEPTLWIEPKGFDSFEVKNHLGIIMTGNEDWQVQATGDERRYASFKVSEKYRGNFDYFQKLFAQMDDEGGLPAMLHDLLAMELGDWHPRSDVPQTDSLAEQQVLSLPPLESWWNDILYHGALPGDLRGTGQVLFSDLKADVAKRRQLQDVSNFKLAKFLDEYGKRGRTPGTRLSMFAFSTLYSVRRKWNRKYPKFTFEEDSEEAEWQPDENRFDGDPNAVVEAEEL